jgi:hypothetical protein
MAVPLISNIGENVQRGENYKYVNLTQGINDIWRIDEMTVNPLKPDVHCMKFKNSVLTDHNPAPLQSCCIEK